MEIERQYLIDRLPEDLEKYPSVSIEQGYICTEPVIRIRKADDRYELTCKGEGLIAREELNLPLTEETYRNLLLKIEHSLIRKTRYRIPWMEHTIELNIFHGVLAPLCMAEVEFETLEAAGSFTPPDWFGQEVTYDPAYKNNRLCLIK